MGPFVKNIAGGAGGDEAAEFVPATALEITKKKKNTFCPVTTYGRPHVRFRGGACLGASCSCVFVQKPLSGRSPSKGHRDFSKEPQRADRKKRGLIEAHLGRYRWRVTSVPRKEATRSGVEGARKMFPGASSAGNDKEGRRGGGDKERGGGEVFPRGLPRGHKGFPDDSGIFGRDVTLAEDAADGKLLPQGNPGMGRCQPATFRANNKRREDEKKSLVGGRRPPSRSSSRARPITASSRRRQTSRDRLADALGCLSSLLFVLRRR